MTKKEFYEKYIVIFLDKKNYDKKKIKKLLLGIIIFFIIMIMLSRIMYNVSNSIPTGLYFKKFFPKYEVGRIATFNVKEKYEKYVLTPKEKELSDKVKKRLKIGKTFIKRIAAKEGDKIQIKNKILYINGKKRGPVFGIKGLEEKVLDKSYILKKDEFFMLGDTDMSFDSRYYGPIQKKEFTGEAVYILKNDTLKKVFGIDLTQKRKYKIEKK